MAASLSLLVLLVTLRTGRHELTRTLLLSAVSGVVAVNLQYQRMKNAIPEVISMMYSHIQIVSV